MPSARSRAAGPAVARQRSAAVLDVPLGEGYAAAAVRDGCVYVLDHVHDVPIDLLRGLNDEERKLLADTLGPHFSHRSCSGPTAC